MRMSQLAGRRLKEDPKDAQMISHKYLIRGGYIRQLSTGIYSFLPIGYKIKQKVEQIIREEMNLVDGQEVLMPVVHPADLWRETGRYDAIGSELLRFKDRTDKDNVLAMTHEEAAVQCIRNDVSSYKQLPFMIYQFQTKFRDEPRSRGGLIRVREFTMKDAYSFHASQNCLESYYQKVFDAYMRVFKRAGLKEYISVESDTGIMGGGKAHEFMSINDHGEDTLIICPKCGYRANKEVAEGIITHYPEAPKKLEKVATPNVTTIEEVAALLQLPTHRTAKAVFYKTAENKLVFAVIRGDLEVNETKLKKILQSKDLAFANDEDIRAIGAVPGYASPLAIDNKKVRVLIDESVEKSNNLVCGANEKDFHYFNFNLSDLEKGTYEIVQMAAVRDGDGCVECNTALTVKKGIEIGNIFQLGLKYSVPMNATFLDEEGKSKPMIMASYGIGVGRLIATVIEDNHDDYGPIWPMSVAPYEVQLCGLNMNKDNTKEKAEQLYKDLQVAGLDVLFDDRDERPGVQFNDADLIGVPVRVIISPKTLENGSVELKLRGVKDATIVPIGDIVEKVKTLVESEKAKYR